MTTEDYTATLPRKRMGAGVLLSDAAGRVLLVEPTYKPDWELPGGCVEADESPLVAARREAEEELGLTLPVGRLLVVDWVAPRPGRTEGLMMVFDGGVLDPAATITLPADELRSFAWCDEGETAERVSDLLALRVRAAVLARDEGDTRYLENGCSVR